MWSIVARGGQTPVFDDFEPADVLYEFDGPRIFTLQDQEGELHLACWSDEDEHACRYLVVPTTAAILQGLRSGRLSVRDALNQPRCWICDLRDDGSRPVCQRIDFDSIPGTALPFGDTLLWPVLEHEPVEIPLEGRIRELDKDQRSFELREIDAMPPRQRFLFDDSLLRDVLSAFQDDVWVSITGRNSPQRSVAQAMSLTRIAMSARQVS